MAIAYDSIETSTGDNATVNVPSNTNDDDLLIAIWGQQDTGLATPGDLPGAFTDQEAAAGASNQPPMEAGSRIASSEPASYGFTGTSLRAAILLATGADTSAPVNASDNANGSGSTQTAPSVTTDIDGCLIVHAMTARTNVANKTSSPGGTTVAATIGSGPFLEIVYYTQMSAGATGTASWTTSTSPGWGAITLALAPPSGISIPVIMHHRTKVLGCL